MRTIPVEPGLGVSDPGDKLRGPLGFGKIFADRMITAKWSAADGWHDFQLGAYRGLTLDPAANVLHYGQEIFEGFKAYRWQDGTIALFRPDRNADRFADSAERMCMPVLPTNDFLASAETLVRSLARWVPAAPGSLYVRPTMIGTEAFLGVRAAKQYLFYMIASPVESYFPRGFSPVRVDVTRAYVRAVRGGTGAAKTAGNYAASLKAQETAKKHGFDQVLWLDAIEQRWVEELGGMNFFAVYGDHLVTPELTGSILAGVTRESVLTLARDLGFTTEQRAIDIHVLMDEIREGKVTELFACGTAAVVTPVETLRYGTDTLHLPNAANGTVATQLYNRLTGLQFGTVPDEYGWVRRVAQVGR